MSEQRVDLLYDALHAFEARRRGGRSYPVHKTLSRERFGDRDIYDWIVEQIEPRGVRHVLDAGCGVGYGAIRLAQKLGCDVTGVTLSERELASARAAARDAGLLARVQFRRSSFDDLPAGAYDLVVAVESLKHSGDLTVSLRSILASLKHGGQLVIVDDFYDGRRRAVERQLGADWELVRLYTERDFLAALGTAAQRRVVDLSEGVRRRPRWAIATRASGLALLRPFLGERASRALRALRGGLRLETLYADGAMAYKALFCVKDGG